jgi:hypothetical protein
VISAKRQDAPGFVELPLPPERDELLPVSGGNLGAPLSRRGGNNFTKVSCHQSSLRNLLRE